MKKRLTVLSLALVLAHSIVAQTADDYVAQGRAHLAVTNIVAANTSFSNAVALSPNHQTASVFYGATRLLVLPSQSAGSNFLNRIGLPVAGRDIYNWTAEFPADTNGVPLAPAGVNANESTAMLRTNVLPALIAAEANLAKVTDTNFTLSLTSNETRIVAVTLDYGDILMLRAILQAAEYFAYTTYSWNLDAQLAAIRSLYTNDELSIERVLMDYPNLLTFATTNDLNSAKLAFQNGANRYMEASQVIRSRSTNVTRLFNYDAGTADAEQNFRLTLADLTNSLSTAVTLAVETNYTVFLGAHFTGLHSPRSFLPWFRGSGFGLKTLPDSTFGGLIYGLNGEQVDEFLAEYLFPIPTFSPIFSNAGGQFQFPINLAKGRGYVIQVSTNLLNWVDYSAFLAFEGRYEFTDATGLPGRFYRLVDRTENMPPPANDAFANRAIIPSMNSPVTSYTTSASYEPAETNWLSGIGHTIWWSWTSSVSDEVAVLVVDGDDCWPINIFTGSSLAGLIQVANDYNDVRFDAQAGVTYQIAVDTCWQDGGVKLVITRPPTLTVSSPMDGAVFVLPASISVSGSASDPDGQIQGIFVEAWPGLKFRSTTPDFSFQWTNVSGGYYYLDVVATDNVGCQTWDSRFIRVHPVNDDFANATPISGAPLTAYGSNAGANKEAGEPNHAGQSGGSSVWWSWTPTSTGPVTILCDITNQWGSAWPLLGVYTGSDVSNLTLEADNAPSHGTTALVSGTPSVGETYRIAVDSYQWDVGNVTLRFIPTAAPTVAITNPLNNATFIGPTNIQVSAEASDSDGSIIRVEFYAEGSLIGTRYALPYSITWSNVPTASYDRELVAYAVDNSGVGVFSAPIYVTVRPPPPPNDNFANRTLLTSTNTISASTTVGATVETGEPYHAGWYRNHSVWWSWQAPKSGTVTVTATGTDYSYLVMGVYNGSAVSGLTYVASGVYGGWPYSSCSLSFSATSGSSYAIAVDGGGIVGPVSLSIVQP